jgi:hypothetical protein
MVVRRTGGDMAVGAFDDETNSGVEVGLAGAFDDPAEDQLIESACSCLLLLRPTRDLVVMSAKWDEALEEEAAARPRLSPN